MNFLIDTSVLGRLADTSDPLNPVADQALVELHRRGDALHITPQNLIEFRSAATRAKSANGLGLSAAEVDGLAADFEATFPLLPETQDIYPAWKQVVAAVGAISKQVYDARLVAVCHVHGITHMLTFNVVHFARFSAIPPGIIVVDPANV
ncbi:hypothetical protein AYO40_06010 [Planctomycetaceae bacterium SCGC AG-212-D15]|nr:hypothetical protein AYO40_06010 [Planctomycetaceae bacterium SCGC AG-212-D15]